MPHRGTRDDQFDVPDARELDMLIPQLQKDWVRANADGCRRRERRRRADCPLNIERAATVHKLPICSRYALHRISWYCEDRRLSAAPC